MRSHRFDRGFATSYSPNERYDVAIDEMIGGTPLFELSSTSSGIFGNTVLEPHEGGVGGGG